MPSPKHNRYAVIGDPVDHSLSPVIHQQFAHHLHQPIEYDAIRVAPEHFSRAVPAYFAQGYQGFSVTSPLKKLAFHFANEHTAAALEANAANTLFFTSRGRCLADNTDGAGLLTDLKDQLGYVLANKTILMLGAGGAAQNIMGAFLKEKPRVIFVANRSLENAKTLCLQFNLPMLVPAALSDLPSMPFDFIINAARAELAKAELLLDHRHFHANTVYYNLAYGKQVGAQLGNMKQRGLRYCHDGLGMLIEQAALQFRLWRGVMPDRAFMSDMRRQLAVEKI